MTGKACVPIRVILFAVSAGKVLLEKRGGLLRLPETWLEEGETLCGAAQRLASSIVGEDRAKPVAVVWFAEDRSEGYSLVFAIEVFIEAEPGLRDEYVMLRIPDAVKLVDDPLHRRFLQLMHVFKPRPLLVCSSP